MIDSLPQNTTYLAETRTSIKTTVNGKEFNLESNDSGSVSVQTINGETTVQTSPGMKISITQGEEKEEIKKVVAEKKTTIKKNIWKQFEKFFKNIFNRFTS